MRDYDVLVEWNDKKNEKFNKGFELRTVGYNNIDKSIGMAKAKYRQKGFVNAV